MLQKIEHLNVEAVMCGHGVCLRWRMLLEAVKEFQRFSSLRTDRKVVVLYDSMYGSTARAAVTIGEGVMKTGCSVVICDLKSSNISKVAD